MKLNGQDSLRITVCLMLFFLIGSDTFAQSPPPDAKPIYDEGVKDVLDSVISSRAAIKSWVLRAKCVEKYQNCDERSELSVFGAFDEKNDRIRFESRGAIRMALAIAGAIPNNENKPNSGSRMHDSISLIVKSDDYMMEWYGIGKPSRPEYATCLRELRDRDSPWFLLGSGAFNPLAAGLIDISSPNRMESIAAAFKRYERNAIRVSRRDGPNNSIQLVYEYTHSFRRTVNIDKEHGFSITHVSFTRLDASGAELPMPRIESSAKWETKQGILVPVNFSWSMLMTDETSTRVDYTVDWESLHPEDFEDGLFDYRTFKDFCPGLDLLDVRDGKKLKLEEPERP